MALCGPQVLVSHAESKDGSGGPSDYDDLESEEKLFPSEAPELKRVVPEPHSVITVRLGEKQSLQGQSGKLTSSLLKAVGVHYVSPWG